MKKHDQPLIEEGWWVDYLEGEFSHETNQDMEMILDFSKMDQLILTNLSRIREILLMADEADQLPKESAYYDQLHHRIMHALKLSMEKTPIEVQLSLD